MTFCRFCGFCDRVRVFTRRPLNTKYQDQNNNNNNTVWGWTKGTTPAAEAAEPTKVTFCGFCDTRHPLTINNNKKENAR